MLLYYVKGWFTVDAISSIPFSLILAALPSEAPGADAPWGVRSNTPVYTAIEWLGLFRLARIFRFGQPITSWLSDNHWLRVPLLVFLFVLLAHWLGLIWYAIAIWPLHYDPSAMNLTTAQLSDYPQYNGAAVAAAASGKAGDLGADAIQQLPWVWLSG